MTWPNFSREEFACQHCGRNEIQDTFIDSLQIIRTRVGFPLIITSGYRCPEHPIEARKDSPGAHTTGLAADIAVSHEQAYKVLQAALGSHRFSGIGIQQKGGDRFIHLDDIVGSPERPRPTVWSY